MNNIKNNVNSSVENIARSDMRCVLSPKDNVVEVKEDLSKVWLTSDLHFNHKNIIKYCHRPFENVDEMNEKLIENFNQRVGKNDIVFNLGDVTLGSIDKVEYLVSRLNGYHILVAGNHDKCWRYNYQFGEKFSDGMRKYFAAGFDQVYPSGILKVLFKDDQRDPLVVSMSHFGYDDCSSRDPHGDRYEHVRPIDEGLLNLCGHVHDSWKIINRNLNVGVDVWDYRPVNMVEVLDFYQKNQ